MNEYRQSRWETHRPDQPLRQGRWSCRTGSQDLPASMGEAP